MSAAASYHKWSVRHHVLLIPMPSWATICNLTAGLWFESQFFAFSDPLNQELYEEDPVRALFQNVFIRFDSAFKDMLSGTKVEGQQRHQSLKSAQAQDPGVTSKVPRVLMDATHR